MAILKIRDSNGNVQEVLVIKGEDGKDGQPGKDGVDGEDGLPGEDYVLTNADKQEIAEMVAENLSTEAWTFTLEDSSTVTKVVVLK